MALKVSIPGGNVTSVASNAGPTLATVAPVWVVLTNKLLAFEARREELIAKIPALQKAINAAGLASFRELNVGRPQDPPKPVGASPRAAKLLGEFTPAPVLPENAPGPEPRVVAEMRQISDELAALDEAIKLLRPQLAKAHVEGSAELCKQLLPEYRKLAGRICAALVELGCAHIEHDRFMAKHRSAFKAKLRPVHGAGSLGDPRDPHSEIRRLLQWAAECGHFQAENLPEEWTKRRAAAEIYQWPEGTRAFDQG
jgi:hypothetical protein